jgi:ribA/ribD-fused uncharacterized protein
MATTYGDLMINDFRGKYRFLSNFYPSPISDKNGNVYPTVEHAFQACKTRDPAEQERIRQAASPGEAKKIGRSITLREGWEEIKLGVMLHCLHAKFRNPELAAQLLATGDQELIEGNTWGDRYWGVCNGTGENHLGRLLMQVREELRGTSVNA